MSGRSKFLRIVYSEIKDRVFSTKDRTFLGNHFILLANYRILLANDRILLANDRVLSIKIVLYQPGSNIFDDTLEQDRRYDRISQ